jgi:NAD-dependent deacetylase
MATYDMFSRYPEEVWRWYLYRMGICKTAEPNAGHRALASLENRLLDRFTLITQNVDGLHIRAGNSLDRTYQIHGNVFFMRCSKECSRKIYPIPSQVSPKKTADIFTDLDRKYLRCPACGEMSRPHVLWFDETYNEEYYKFYSSLKVARETGLLVIVGTAGATNLPNQIAWEVLRSGGLIMDINIMENPFSELAKKSGGVFIKSPSSKALIGFEAIFDTK